jgi:gliding motility-associated-like protein
MRNNYLLLFILFTSFNVLSQAPLIQVNVPAPLPACLPGDCTDLFAVYPTLEQTTSYAVAPITYNPTFPFTIIPGQGTLLDASADDVWSPVVNLPFPFTFYGITYNKVIVGSNGVISFDITNAGGFCPWAFTATIPSTTFPIRNAIYGVYQDTDIRNPPVSNPTVQNVNYYILDTGVNAAPNRVFVANWNELPLYLGAGTCSPQGNQTSQIAIHEGTNYIDIIVNNRQCCTGWNSGSGVIGTQNAAGTLATVAPGRNSSCWSTTNEAWQIRPTGPANVPATLKWEKSGGIPVGALNENPLNVCPTGPETYTAIVEYTNPDLSKFSVRKNVTVDIAAPLPLLSPQPITICSAAAPPYTVNIDQTAYMTSSIPDPANYVILYYENPTDAANGASTSINQPADDSALATYTFSSAPPKTIYVRIESLTTGCYNIRPFDINIGSPSGTISYDASPYCNNLVPQQPVTNHSLTSGGSYSATPAGLNLDLVSGAINAGSTPGIYTVKYEIAASGACPVFFTTANVEIIACTCSVIAPSTSQTLCANTALTPMTFTVSGGATGASLIGAPAWLTGTLAAGVYTLTASTPVPGTYNFTVSIDSGADNCTVPVTINVKLPSDAGTDGNTTVCDSNAAVITLSNLITGEQTGGAWTRSTGTGGTFNAAAGTFIPTGASTSNFVYTITGITPCPDDTSVATVNVVAQPTAGADDTISVCDNSATVITLSNIITGEQTGGAWTRTGGSGGTFNAAAGTFIPAPGATTSTFNYTLVGGAPCANDFSIATVNINAQPNAGADGGTSVCDSSAASISLSTLIVGEQAGGTWARTGGTGGTFTAATGIFTPAPGATSSTFTYTILGTAPCVDDFSIASVTITAQPNAGADGTASVCDSDTTVINLFSLIAAAQTGGTWTRTGGAGGTFNAAAGTFAPAPGATSSAFTYTLTGAAPCINDSSVVAVTISPQANAGVDNSVTICDSSAAVITLSNIITGEQAGGTWTRTSGTGGTFNAAAGTFTPAPGAATSDFTYTVTGTGACANDTSIATVNINAQPNAGVDGSTTVCDNSTAVINLATFLTGGQTGGTWTRTSGTGGIFNAAAGTFEPAAGAISSIFTYTLLGTAPCIADSSTVSITIVPQRNAGADDSVTICDSSAAVIALSGIITGEQAGGSWARIQGIGGVFNAAAGTFTPAPGATTSKFTYTLLGTTPCGNDDSLATININPQPNAGLDGTKTVCDSDATAIDLFNLISGEQTGGVWTRTGGTGGTFDGVTGRFIPAPGATTSTFTYTITGVAPCITDDSTAIITIIAQPNAGTDNAITVCDSSATLIDLSTVIIGAQAGGTWTRTGGSGGTFNAALGTFIPAPGATSSAFTYTIPGTIPCPNDFSIATVNINAQPNAGADGGTSVCDSSAAAISLSTLITGEQAGGIWARTGGTGGTFTAGTGTFTPAGGATSSTFTYTILGTAPCVDDFSIASVTITAQPNAGADGAASVCDSDTTVINLFSLIAAAQTGGTWARTGGAGGTFNAAAGTFAPAPGATSSAFTYTLTGAAPCINDSSVVAVTISPQANAGVDNSVTICDSSAAVITLSNIITGEQAGGTWTRTSGTGGTFNAAAGTFTPSPGAATSDFTYTVTGTGACANDTSIATVNINAQPNAGVDGSTTVCDSNLAAINLFSLITGEQAGGSWTRTGGAGGTFNASAGTFEPAGGATSSAFTYTITGTAPCISDSSVVNITVNPAATIVLTSPVSSDSQSLCINTALVTIKYNLGNGATGASITSGGLPLGVTSSYNAIAGTFTISGTPTSAGNFTYHITTTGGCPSPGANGTIEVKAKVTMILDSDATSAFQTKCITEAITPIRYLVGASATGATATGLPSGLSQSFNPANGILTISGNVNTAGTFNFNVSTSGGCGVVTLPGSIVVNPAATISLTSAPATAAQRVCINEQLTNIDYTIATGATSASITSGSVPRGIQGNLGAGGIFTISGTPTEFGTFSYTITTTGGCSSAVISGTITVDPLPVVDLPQHGFICVDESGNPQSSSTYVLDTGLTAPAYSFVWSDVDGVISGQSGGSYETTKPGTYTVEVTNTATGCSNIAAATVVPSLPPTAIFTAVSNYFSQEQVVTVNATPLGIYEYQLDNGAFQDDNQFMNLNSGTHTIVVRDKFGCGIISTTVRIIDYPRFFTPNGDGYNDVWNVSDLSDQTDSRIYIFDRYGKLIKEIRPNGTGWDGTFNAVPLPSSDYWFKIYFKEDGAQKEFKSHFTLKR